MISIGMFRQRQITLNTVIEARFLYQLMNLRFICYKLKLIDVITISTSLSISHDLGNHVTYYSTVEIDAVNMHIILQNFAKVLMKNIVQRK